MLRLFCENAKSTSDEDGIPYVDELTKQVTVSVSPAKVVERVIQDLTDAATCLANDPVLTGREVSTSEDDGYLVNRNYHLNYYCRQSIFHAIVETGHALIQPSSVPGLTPAMKAVATTSH